MAYTENVDPFSFSTAGLAQTYSQANSYFPYPYRIENSIEWQNHANDVSMRIVPIFLLVMLEKVTGLSMVSFLFLPIMGLFFTLLLFIIAKKFVKSTLVAFLFVIVMNYTFFPINIHYISVGLCLFLLFVMTLLKFMETQENKSSLVFLLFVIFISIYYSYYTAEFLVFCLLFGALVFPWLTKRLVGAKIPTIKLSSLLLCFVIIFVYFDHQFYNYFTFASYGNISESLNSYFEYVMHFLQMGGSAVTDYRPQISNSVTVYADLFQRALITISLAFYSFYFVKSFRKNSFDLSYKSVAFLSLFFVGFMQIVLYSSVGYAQHIWSLYLVSALAAFFVLNTFRMEMKKRKKLQFSALFVAIMLLIVSSGAAIFVLKAVDPVNPNGYRLYSLMEPAAVWSVSNLDSGYVAADSRTAAQLFLETAHAGKEDVVYPYRLSSEVSYLYSLDVDVPYKLFGNKSVCLLISYEFQARSFLAGNQWSYCPPLGDAISFLDSYPTLNRVYDDGQGLVYRYESDLWS